MTYRELIAKLQKDYPGSHWTLRGNTYESLEWLDDPSTKPSAEDLGLGE